MSDAVHPPRRSVFDHELARVRELALSMGEFVERAISRSVAGLVELDTDSCDRVVAADADLNALQLQLRELAVTTILTQAPVGDDLRLLLGFLHMSAELERMGDHCVSIAKIARELADLPSRHGEADLARMAELCRIQLSEMLEAVIDRDAERARVVASHDDRVDRIYRRIFDEQVAAVAAEDDTAFRATRLIFVAHHLERIADRVTNMGEDLVYLATGAVEELG